MVSIRRTAPELWRTTEVAEALGVEVTNLSKIADLPPPWTTVGWDDRRQTRLWLAADVRPFARGFRERTGRPPFSEPGG